VSLSSATEVAASEGHCPRQGSRREKTSLISFELMAGYSIDFGGPEQSRWRVTLYAQPGHRAFWFELSRDRPRPPDRL
jgi:hypothetical protein